MRVFSWEQVMSSERDWRNAEPYERAETYPARGLAWEFLRRDLQYRETYRTMRWSPSTLDAAVGRWGLRVRGRSAPGRDRR